MHTYIHTYIHTTNKKNLITEHYRDIVTFIDEIPFDKLNAESQQRNKNKKKQNKCIFINYV